MLQPAENSEDGYRGISDAFAAALHHTFIPGEIAVIIAVVAGCVAAVAIARWMRRERARLQAERTLEQRRLSEAKAASAERREFVRVPAHVSLSIPSIAPNGRPSVFETQDVSGGGLSFNSRTPPPIGTELELVLDLEIDGIPSDLPLRAEVVRVQPSLAPRGPAIVGVAFRGLAAATRNALLRWIAAEETREIANQRRGPLCSVCRRPLGDIGAKMHPTCVPATTATTSRPPKTSHPPAP